MTWIVYSSGSHGFLSPKILRKHIKESDMARALKLWYRGGLGELITQDNYISEVYISNN